MMIDILDVPRCRPNRVQGTVVVAVPPEFDRGLDTGVLDRLGIDYTVTQLPLNLFWYRVPRNICERPLWRVDFHTPNWQVIQPWLYHAGFDAGYAGSWLDQGWRRPNTEIGMEGRITVTDSPVLDQNIWAALVRGEPVEPVDTHVRDTMRGLGFELLISADPPRASQRRAEWLLSAEPNTDPELLAQRRDLSRQILQGQLTEFLSNPVPVWAGEMQRLRQEIVRAAGAEGFWVPKV